MTASATKALPPRTVVNFWVDVVLLAAALVTFGSGLVLLLCFHVGEGPFATSAGGVERLTFLNLHRLPAIIVLAGTAAHVAVHWDALATRVWRTFAGPARGRPTAEVVLYFTFSLVVLMGFVIWVLVGESTPLSGPVLLARPSPDRHPWIDVHNLMGLLALGLAVWHVVHRWRWISHTAARLRNHRSSGRSGGGEEVDVQSSRFLSRAALLMLIAKGHAAEEAEPDDTHEGQSGVARGAPPAVDVRQDEPEEQCRHRDGVGCRDEGAEDEPGEDRAEHPGSAQAEGVATVAVGAHVGARESF